LLLQHRTQFGQLRKAERCKLIVESLRRVALATWLIITAMGDSQEPVYLCLGAVNIFVRDVERSLQFYLGQLGFNLAFDKQLQSGRRWVAVSPPDGAVVLTLIAPAPESREYALIGGPRR